MIREKIKKIKTIINKKIEQRKKDKAAAERLGIGLSMYRRMVDSEYPEEFKEYAKDWREAFDKNYTSGRYEPLVHHEPLYNVPYSNYNKTVSREVLLIIKEEQAGRELPVERITYYLQSIIETFDKWEKDIAAVKEYICKKQ